MQQFIYTILLLLSSHFSFSQGKYAGSMKRLIGVTYTDSENIPGLKGWEFKKGSVITAMDEPHMIIASVYSKGKTWIIFFSIMEDTASSVYSIMDVAEVKNVLQGWEVYTTTCRKNKIENVEIVALVKWSPSQEFLKPAKQAWRFNRDKRRFEFLSVKGIDCINEGLE